MMPTSTWSLQTTTQQSVACTYSATGMHSGGASKQVGAVGEKPGACRMLAKLLSFRQSKPMMGSAWACGVTLMEIWGFGF